MKYVRWLSIALLIFVMGYLGFLGLFADGSNVERAIIALIFIAAGVGVGALTPQRWYLAVLGSWGVLLLVLPELTFRANRGPIDGAQPIMQVFLTGLIGVGLALASGYMGGRLRG